MDDISSIHSSSSEGYESCQSPVKIDSSEKKHANTPRFGNRYRLVQKQHSAMAIRRGVLDLDCSFGSLKQYENDANISVRRQKQISERPSNYAKVFASDENLDSPMRVISKDNSMIFRINER